MDPFNFLRNLNIYEFIEILQMDFSNLPVIYTYKHRLSMTMLELTRMMGRTQAIEQKWPIMNNNKNSGH